MSDERETLSTMYRGGWIKHKSSRCVLSGTKSQCMLTYFRNALKPKPWSIPKPSQVVLLPKPNQVATISQR